MMNSTTARSNLHLDRVSLGSRVCKWTMLGGTFQDSRRGASSHILRCKRLMPGSILVLVFMMCAKSLDAQAQTVEPPVAAPPATTATPPASSLPDVPDFDLGTEEFENFGEEDFRVEEQLSPAAETTVTAIKVAVGAAIVLLVGFIVMKLLRRKSSVRS